MADPFLVLGGRDGELLVLSDEPAFADSHAVRVGESLVPFTPYDVAPVSLIHGLDVLGHATAPPESPWRRPDSAPLARFRNREWAVGGQSPWLLTAEPGEAGVSVTCHHPDFGVDVPVVARLHYRASVRLAAIQAEAELVLTFRDAAGEVVATARTRAAGTLRGGTDADAYERVVVRATAPDSAVTARLEAVLSGHLAEPSAVGGRGFLLLLDHELTAAPGKAPRWRPDPAAVPHLVRAVAGQGATTVFAAPVELGLGTQLSHADVVALDEMTTLATWDPGLGDATARLGRVNALGMVVRVTGTLAPVGLYFDGEFVSAAPAATGGDPAAERKIVLPIPARWRDDNEHVVQLRDLSGCHLLVEMLRTVPGIQSSWAFVQEHATRSLPFERAPAAKYRYVSLRRQLARLDARFAAGVATAEDLAATAQLSRVHGALERGFERNRDFSPLTFPRVEHPTVSVIVPVHNKFAVTYHCLASLLLAPNDVDFEVVVVDDGSSDETLGLADVAAGVTVVRHEEARGFVGACTSGAAAARGEFLVLLNNDTEPTAGWLDELIAGFERFDDVGMTGARLLWPDGRVQDAGGLVWENGNPANYGRGFSAADPRVTYARQVDYVSGAALMIRRTVWDEVGGLSQEYAPAYFEDTDLSFKVREAGYTTWLIPSANVFHIEGVSNGTEVETTSGLKRFQEINRPKFQAKWRHAFVGKGEQGVNPDLEKDRGISGRVLFIDRAVPQPDKDAGSYAAIVEMRLVQSLGYKVTFLPVNLTHMGPYNDELLRLGIEVIHAPYASSPADFLRQRGTEFDAVYITRYNIAERVLADVRRRAPQAKVLFCNADLHFLRLQRAAQRSGDEALLAEAAEVRDAELAVMNDVEVVLSYNTVEHDVIAEHGVATPVVTCPWVVETAPDEAVPGFAEREGIAFLGGYLHTPNVEAVEYFVAEVLPKLRDRVPGVRFNIYGSHMPARFLELADEVVRPVGFVETVEEVYDSNRLFIAPLLSGAGIKGKVLGALAQGIPSVLSPVAAEGTGVVDGQDCLVAESADEWVEAVATLYDDEQRWRELSANARAFTERTYGFAKGRDLMRVAFVTAGVQPSPR